jgi:hypothetical protein
MKFIELLPGLFVIMLKRPESLFVYVRYLDKLLWCEVFHSHPAYCLVLSYYADPHVTSGVQLESKDSTSRTTTSIRRARLGAAPYHKQKRSRMFYKKVTCYVLQDTTTEHHKYSVIFIDEATKTRREITLVQVTRSQHTEYMGKVWDLMSPAAALISLRK